MSKRIVLNLTKCVGCESCDVKCGYFYSPLGADHGIQSLKERATFAVVCRQCAHPGCVTSCPYDALERQADGSIKRFNLRCVSCKLCTQGCPFGTIYPEMVGFYVTPCEHCIDESEGEPPCVTGCVKDAIEYRETDVDEDELPIIDEHPRETPAEAKLHIIDEHFAVIAPKWEREHV